MGTKQVAGPERGPAGAAGGAARGGSTASGARVERLMGTSVGSEGKIYLSHPLGLLAKKGNRESRNPVQRPIFDLVTRWFPFDTFERKSPPADLEDFLVKRVTECLGGLYSNQKGFPPKDNSICSHDSSMMVQLWDSLELPMRQSLGISVVIC